MVTAAKMHPKSFTGESQRQPPQSPLRQNRMFKHAPVPARGSIWSSINRHMPLSLTFAKHSQWSTPTRDKHILEMGFYPRVQSEGWAATEHPPKLGEQRTAPHPARIEQPCHGDLYRAAIEADRGVYGTFRTREMRDNFRHWTGDAAEKIEASDARKRARRKAARAAGKAAARTATTRPGRATRTHGHARPPGGCVSMLRDVRNNKKCANNGLKAENKGLFRWRGSCHKEATTRPLKGA